MPDIHVYPTGNDDDLPVLREAAAEQRRLRSGSMLTEPVRILLHAGTYTISRPIHLTQDDFGSVRAPVIWTAFGDGEVILKGSHRVSAPIPDDGSPVAFQLEPGTPVNHLYLAGKRLTPARYPDLPVDDPIHGGWLYADEPPFGEAPVRKRFWSRHENLRSFPDLVGARVRIFPRHNFTCDTRTISSYDAETGEIVLDLPATYEIDPGNRFFIKFVRDALDQPGEWIHDTISGQLLVLAEPDATGMLEVDIPTTDHIFDICGAGRRVTEPRVNNWPYWDDVLRTMDPPGSAPVTHLVLRGLTLEETADSAILVESCAAILIEHCAVRNTGKRGITVIGGDSCTIADCEISRTSAEGALLAGGMRRPFGSVIIASHHLITNCHIHHVGLDEKHIAGIALTGAGNRVEHCVVHDTPRWGIHSRGNDHRIEYNHVHHVCLETTDCGGIYLCDRDWLMRGTSIRFNRVHHVIGFSYDNSTPIVYGIYLDDWTSGVTVHGNLVHDTPRAGIFVNSGHRNNVTNNIVAAGGIELARFQRWPEELEFERVGTDRHGFQKNVFEGNILLGTGGAGSTAIYDLENLIFAGDRVDFGNNTLDRNLLWVQGPITVRLTADGIVRTIDWETWRTLTGQDAASLMADPMLDENWQFQEGSPARAIGFRQLPVLQMGTRSREIVDSGIR